MEKLRWLRIVGHTTFVMGAISLAWFSVGLATGWSVASRNRLTAESPALSDEVRIVAK